MGFFSDIISSIGNGISDVFDGGGNSDQKKKQQQQQQAPQAPAPSFNNGPVKLPAVFQAAQQQQQNNPFHLVNNNPAPGANPLQPQQPQNNAPQLQTSNYQVAPEHQSLFGQLVHGAGSLIKGVAQPFVNTGEDVSNAIGNGEVGLAHALGIHAGQTESNQQQFGGINNAVGLKTEANTPKNFLLNTAQVAGTVLAPGADSAAEAGAQAALNPDAANTAIQLARMGLHQASDDAVNGGFKAAVINTGAKVGANSLIGGGFNAANGVENGENPGQVAKDFGVGALVGGGLSGAAGVVPIIRGARAADDEAAGASGEKVPAESGTKAPGEPTNAPAGEAAPPEKAPGAAETGVKSPVTISPHPNPNITPAEIAANNEASAQAGSLETSPKEPPVPVAPSVPEPAPVVSQAREVPDYTSPHKNGKASVPGNSQARYSTGDPNLDAIVNDSIIAHKGTSATAGTRADALDQVGITSAQRAQIRNIATKNVDKNTGKISASGVKQIEKVVKTPKSGVGRVRPDGSVVDKVIPLNEVPKTEPAATSTSAEPTPQAAPAERPEAPNIKKTGNTEQDLQNAAALVRHTLENPRDFGAGEGVKPGDALGTVIDKLNARPGDQLAETLGKRFGTHLTDTEAENVEHAIQTGSTKGLSDKESAVVKSLVNDVEKPSDVSRSNLSTDYQSRENHFPQVRAPGSATDAVKAASSGKGLSGKVRNLDDVLNTDSRFSENSSMGKFTDEKGNTLIGDAPNLGLKPDGEGNYTDGKKTYTYSPATSRELRSAGVNLQAPKDALTTYVKDTLAQKDRADAADYLKGNPEKVGLSKTSEVGKSTPVSIKGSDGKEDTFFTDPKTAAKVQEALNPLPDKTSALVKGFNKATSGVAQLTVMNPSVHTANLANNAFVEAGAKYAKYAVDPKLDDNVLYEMRKGGTYIPSYGKDQVGVISKLTHGASKVNERVMSNADLRIRYGMFRKFTEDDKLTPTQASQRINKALGGKSVYGNGQAQFGIFWHYFVTQNKFAGRILAQAAKGNVAPLVRAGVATGLLYGADKGEKALFGNKQAYVRPPGVLGIANDYMNSAKDLATGQYRNAVSPILNHVNPLVAQGAEQALGVDNYGNKFTNGQERVNNALGMTPVTNMLANNGHSVAEKALNTFGLYTPHIKGDMAVSPNTPGASILNVKNAQNGSTEAFPKDFQGNQESNETNKLGGNYTTKLAGIMGSLPLSQQQKIVQATTTLKKYGITDATDIQNFSKLAPKDQGSYVDAVDALNKAGTAISSSAVQGQLVKNGNVALAAGMNKSIPNQIPQDQKNTLETYSTLGSDGQKNVWLQNNDNADNYYKSVIAKKQAQGALTTDDTDTGTAYSGSGGSLYVKALVAQTDKQNNVPQSLVELYKNTDKTEYEDMSGSQKDALTAYAQQLNKNGVIDKFGLATGTSGSGGGSSSTSASAADRAAGLPYGTISESFVKPTSDPGLKSVSARAFKAPTLLKYTPDTKANPYVRSISVSKGIK